MIWECPCTDQLPQNIRQSSDKLIEVAHRAGQLEEGFWLRGLVPAGWTAPTDAGKTPSTELVDGYFAGHTIHAGGDLEDHEVANHFYLDGSGGEHTRDSRLRRCGFASVQIADDDPDPLILGSLHGHLPGAQRQQKVARAELYAPVRTVELAATNKPICLYSDCASVFDEATPAKPTTRLAGRHGDLW